MRSLAVGTVVVLLAAPAFAQERGQAVSENDAIRMKRDAELNMVMRVPLEKQIKGAPYSGDVIVSSSQTLADGNHISRSDTSHVFRDSEGRTRREQSGRMSEVGPGQPIISTQGTIVNIFDPVGGYSYSLDAEHKIAWRTPVGASQGWMSGAPSEEAIAKLKAEKQAQANEQQAVAGMKLEARAVMNSLPPLEHSTIDGLAVQGRKTSETIPAGKIGNEQPITITNEEWTSTDLKVLVLTKHSDPRSGDSTYHLTNVVRAEPDPSLFIVPPDYTVKDTGIRRNNES